MITDDDADLVIDHVTVYRTAVEVLGREDAHQSLMLHIAGLPAEELVALAATAIHTLARINHPKKTYKGVT